MRTSTSIPGVVGPYPRDNQTKAAEHARRHMREDRARSRAKRAAEALPAHPLPPWRRIELTDLPSAAFGFARAAEKVGLAVAARGAGPNCVQVGVARDGVLWMRATWRRPGASWTSQGVTIYGEPVEYVMVHDERPGPSARVEKRVKGKLQMVPDPNRMPRGLKRDHLEQRGGTRHVGVTEAKALWG